MNDKIKTALTKAGVADNWNPADWYNMSPAMVQTFAQLIVLECAAIAKDAQDFYDEHNDGVCNTDISGLLKYNFGIKE